MVEIPKVIHYCWFGGRPMSTLQKKCLKSWKKYAPEYELKLWNEENTDLQSCDYVREAYEAGKYAFVSDYARFGILYEHGGIYLDTDVELVRPLRELPQDGCFMACEEPGIVAPGLIIGAPAGDPLMKEMLDGYTGKHFLKTDGTTDLTTVVDYATGILRKHGLQDPDEIQGLDGVTIYPPRYFCPRSMTTGKVEITQDTFSIHHYAASWETPVNRLRGKIYRGLRRCLGENTAERIRKVMGKKQG